MLKPVARTHARTPAGVRTLTDTRGHRSPRMYIDFLSPDECVYEAALRFLRFLLMFHQSVPSH